jgi:hypothetical protein
MSHLVNLSNNVCSYKAKNGTDEKRKEGYFQVMERMIGAGLSVIGNGGPRTNILTA